MAADNTTEVARLKAAIAEMLRKVPPSIASAGMTTTRAYKTAVEKARKAMDSPRATLLNVQQAYTNLATHWK